MWLSRSRRPGLTPPVAREAQGDRPARRASDERTVELDPLDSRLEPHVVAQVGPIGPRVRAGRARGDRMFKTPLTHVGIQSWLIEGTLVVPDDVSSEIGHAVGGRAGLDQ